MPVIPPRVAVYMWAFIGFSATAAAAQTTNPDLSIEAKIGDCAVYVSLKPATPVPAAPLIVQINKGDLATLVATGSPMVFKTIGRLRAGMVVRAGFDHENWTAAEVEPGGTGRECADEAEEEDTRDLFEASAYTGWAVDNFAPSSIASYVDDPRLPSKTRWIGGVDFAFHILGRRNLQLWISGETLHGVRTADVNCSDPHSAPACGADPADPSPDVKENFRYILKNATTLEAFISHRLEFLTVNAGSTFPARAYVTARFGVVALSGASTMFPAHHYDIGLLASNGPFEGSALEIGWGRTDLSERQPGCSKWHRFRMDALLCFDIAPSFKDRVFDRHRWLEVLDTFRKRRREGKALVHCGRWDVDGNEIYIIAPYSGLNICWLYNYRSSNWVATLPQALREPVFPQPNVKTHHAKQFERFPWFATFGENKPRAIKLKASQVNLLANLAAWTITNKHSKAEIQRAFGDALAPARAAACSKPTGC